MRLADPPPKRRNETRDVLRPIMSRLNRMPGVRVVRNANYGPVYAKRFYDYLRASAYEHPDARPMLAGLGVGSADLVGGVTCTTTDPSHFARLFCLEVKLPDDGALKAGKARPDQDRWLASVRKLGGFACVVRSVDEAMAAVERCRQGESQ
jgi:hypothetical protein